MVWVLRKWKRERELVFFVKAMNRYQVKNGEKSESEESRKEKING